MFAEAGKEESALAAMAAPFRVWLADRLQDGSYFGFMAVDAHRPIAGIGLMIIDWPPHPAHPDKAQRGYVLNVYVEADYRGRGIARALMQAAEAEFSRRGISYAILHATEAGQPLYSSMGWSATTEMAKPL